MRIDSELVYSQLSNTIESFDLPVDLAQTWGPKLSGKVRDCFVHDDKRIIVSSDRLSAFDVILTTIPFKGQLLTEMAVHWFNLTKHIIPNHIISHPHPNVMVCREAAVLPIEVIVRGYLTGSAWRDYQAGKAISGIKLPSGMKRSEKLKNPLLTPSTKAEKGQHDLPISRKEIIDQGIVASAIWEEVEDRAIALYNFGASKARELGLILVDTKYEFGVVTKNDGSKQVIVADEIHTMDSSRYWVSESYEDRFTRGIDPEMLDKEFVRRELMAQGFMGEGVAPSLSDDFRVETAQRYIDAFVRITGKEFHPQIGDIRAEIVQAIRAVA